MKITQLIEKLNQVLDKYGDMPVCRYDDDFWYFSIENIEYVDKDESHTQMTPFVGLR